MADNLYDLVVIGGGINGAGIAADASGRGLRVLLAERDDLAGATSSASSKLIHGGLRYLEHYAFRLVREALAEREVLLAKAPHIVWPLQFVLPHVDGMRPRPLLRAGLLLYDHLARRRTLGRSAYVDLASDPSGLALREDLRHGFAYWDCWVDDARLVVLNAIAARDNGAEILTRTAVTALRPDDALWHVMLGSGASTRSVAARVVVNASGPWVASIAGLMHGGHNQPAPRLRLVKGSHIVVPHIAGTEKAYIFQSVDGRVVFALPFERDFTLIGTTDVRIDGDPAAVEVSADEEDYLLSLASRFFRQPLSRADIVWRFAGVRPLDDDGSDDPSSVSRDYRLDLEPGSPPILHVIGGKITTYRRLAEAALDLLRPHLPATGPSWTASAPLPGGDVGEAGYDAWFAGLAARRPGFAAGDLTRLARRYGTRTETLLGDAKTVADLGAHLGGNLSEREVRFLQREEWAMTADDVLWRRTKTGLHLTSEDRVRTARLVEDVLAS